MLKFIFCLQKLKKVVYLYQITKQKLRLMKTFEALNTVSKLKKGEKVVEIVKFKKVGTKRIFYVPMFEGKYITKTLFARMYDAETIAKAYLNN